MGCQIGMQVAEIMGYKYLDRDILEETAKKMDVSLGDYYCWKIKVSRDII